MTGTVSFKGNPMTLAGRRLKPGDAAMDFRVVSAELKEVTLADFKTKVKVITTFLSADTPVCDLQVKEFNKRASGLSSEVVILGISKDLPFAQKRFCHDNAISNVTLLSDYKYSSFAINYGLLVKELNLLARSVLILDKYDIVRYVQIVQELTSAPDYADALKALGAVLSNPQVPAQGAQAAKCLPCEGVVPALPGEKIEKLIAQRPGWQIVEGKKIVKEFKFNDFSAGKYFLDLVSAIAEEQGHHPTLTLSYNKLKVTLTTHAAAGLTENDFIMAGMIDALEQRAG